MRKFKRLLTMISLCLSVMLVVPIIAPKIPSGVTVEAATKVKLNKSKATLFTGKTLQLKLNGAKGKVTWSSSKKSVATVSKSGKVKAKKNGTATITAKYQGKKYKCIITVKKAVPLKSIKLNKSSVKLEVDDYVQLKVKYNPSNTTVDKEIKWTSSNKNIVSVDEDGFIYANSTGTAKITAKVGGKKATCKVTVKKPIIEAEDITLNKESLSIAVGEKTTLTATVSPSDATNKNVSWTSANEKVAVVNSYGIITAIGVGKTTITASIGDVKKSCEVNVFDGELYVPVACTIDFAYETAKFPKSVVFTSVYYTDDNGAGNELWLIEGYGDNSLGGKSYFYISAMRETEVEKYPLTPYKYYEIGEGKYVRTVAYNSNPYLGHMKMFKTIDGTCATNVYYSIFGTDRTVKFD